jgi:hypothetical protein
MEDKKGTPQALFAAESVFLKIGKTYSMYHGESAFSSTYRPALRIIRNHRMGGSS